MKTKTDRARDILFVASDRRCYFLLRPWCDRGVTVVLIRGQPLHLGELSPLFATKIDHDDPDLDRGGGVRRPTFR